MYSERSSRLGRISERAMIENNSLDWKIPRSFAARTFNVGNPRQDLDDIVTLFSGLSTRQYDQTNVNSAAKVSKMDNQCNPRGFMRYQRANSDKSRIPRIRRVSVTLRWGDPKNP